MTSRSILRRLGRWMPALAVLLAGTGAEAACFTVQAVPSSVSITYSPLDSGDATQTFQIQVTNSCGASGTLQIGVSNTDLNASGAPTGARTSLSYNADIEQGGSNIDLSSNTDQLATVAGGTIADGATIGQTWTVRIPAHSVIPYAQRSFTIYAVGAIDGSYFAVPTTVTVDVAQVTQLSFAGGATSLTVDFGELSTGAFQDLNVNAQATVPFDISWSSANNGVLKNLSDASWTIPYTAVLNGTTVDNSTGYTDTTLGGTQGAVTSLPLHVAVGDISNKRAGTYQDIVTISIAAHP